MVCLVCVFVEYADKGQTYFMIITMVIKLRSQFRVSYIELVTECGIIMHICPITYGVTNLRL